MGRSGRVEPRFELELDQRESGRISTSRTGFNLGSTRFNLGNLGSIQVKPRFKPRGSNYYTFHFYHYHYY